MVGDRLLTDVVFGNMNGMMTVHVRPLTLVGDNKVVLCACACACARVSVRALVCTCVSVFVRVSVCVCEPLLLWPVSPVLSVSIFNTKYVT